MIHGIQASKDINLSNIGRSLIEDIPPKKMVEFSLCEGEVSKKLGKFTQGTILKNQE